MRGRIPVASNDLLGRSPFHMGTDECPIVGDGSELYLETPPEIGDGRLLERVAPETVVADLCVRHVTENRAPSPDVCRQIEENLPTERTRSELAVEDLVPVVDCLIQPPLKAWVVWTDERLD